MAALELIENSLLSLKGYGVAFGEKIILSQVDLQVPEREVTVLLGPSGTGKSTLLRTLAGFNEGNPKLRIWGEATYAGMPVGEGDLPALVLQSARLMMATVLDNIVHNLPERQNLTKIQQRKLAQRLLKNAGLNELVGELDEPVINLTLAQQRHLAIVRLAASGARLICLDEPTSSLSDEEAERLLDYIIAESANRAMLVVLHNQAQARRLQGNTVLLAGGTVHRSASMEAFFSESYNEVVDGFIGTGSCSLPAPGADPETLDPQTAPLPQLPVEASDYVSDSYGPRGFLWLKKGKVLAG